MDERPGVGDPRLKSAPRRNALLTSDDEVRHEHTSDNESPL